MIASASIFPSGQEIKGMTVESAESFEYHDPVDKSVSANQGIKPLSCKQQGHPSWSSCYKRLEVGPVGSLGLLACASLPRRAWATGVLR